MHYETINCNSGSRKSYRSHSLIKGVPPNLHKFHDRYLHSNTKGLKMVREDLTMLAAIEAEAALDNQTPAREEFF
ncbi:hypothetical protein Hypma_010875 [Hypsizygus marmoreus]|uniref:Uncharacterized protein n=1 Tax=Hypsizygus marmoreus TaxID=39966 RepID=A0A369JTI2_HYPMA|nr:hypothetical protein Hypma_010875 [Hypsizygus marmoreus]